MKVLLTGSSGFIGRYVLQLLQAHGIEVFAVGRVHPPSSVPFIEVDLLGITDFGPLLQQVQASHLLHLAWYAEHGKYWTSPLNLRWVDATMRLVESFCMPRMWLKGWFVYLAPRPVVPTTFARASRRVWPR